MAGRLLDRVGPREREMRRLVAHDRPQLVQTGPVREDPDDVGPVRRERALEAVARPRSRRRDDRVDEGDVGVRDAKLPAGVGQRRQRGLDVAWRRRRDPGRSDWMWTPSRAYRSKSGKASRSIEKFRRPW